MPNNDLISRAAAIQSIYEWNKDCDNESINDAVTVVKTLIELLPAVDAIPLEWLKWRIEHAEREGFVKVAWMFRTVYCWWIDQQDTWRDEKEQEDNNG